MKKIFVLFLILISTLSFTGCAETKVENTKAFINTTLDSFIPREEIIYDGLLDYSHTITPLSETKGIFSYEGELQDGIGDISLFKFSYTIVSDGLKELTYSEEGANLYFTSIVPEKIILPTVLEVGSIWKEIFDYIGVPKVCVSTLTKIELMDTGKKVYTVKSYVYNLDDYKDGRYEETRIFEEGFGQIYFEKSIELTEDESGNKVDIGFPFYYAARGKLIQ